MYGKKDLTGETIGGYCITVELGSQSSHRTFLGENLSPTISCQSVIIKLLHPEAPCSLQEQQRFLDEISTLQRLSHPSILPILSAGIYKDLPYIMTRYVALGSLHNRLESRPTKKALPQEYVLSIIAQIGQALHYAHQRHVVHGNIKPQNVLFDTQDEILLTDFALPPFFPSEKTTQTDSTEMEIYRAPEQLSGSSPASEVADQYALGCLCYEMFTGHKPFLIPSVNIPDINYKTKSLVAPRQYNLALHPDIEAAILKAMSREPDQRYSDIFAFLWALGISSTPGDKDQEKVGTALVLGGSANPNRPTELDLPIIAGSASDLAGTAKIASPLEAITPGKEYHFTSARKESRASWGGVGPIQKNWKRLTGTRGRMLILIMSLIAIIIIVATSFITFNFSTSSKKLATRSDTHTTSITHIPTPTSVSVSWPASTPQSSPTPGGIVSPPSPDPTSAPPLSGFTPAPVSKVDTGLTGYWALNEGRGSRVNDSSGNGYTGTLQDGASWASGRAGSYALDIDGNGYVDIPAPVVNTAASFSVAAWVKLNNLSQYQTFVSLNGNQVSAFYLQLSVRAGGTFAFDRLTDDSTSASPGTFAAALSTPKTGVWYHLVGVYDASAQTISLYVNGSLQRTVSFTRAWQGTGHTMIGCGMFGGKYINFVNGQIDDVRIYNTALSSASVASLAAS